MNLSELHVVIADDSVCKAMDIRRALEFCGVRKIASVRDQEKLWEKIYQSRDGGEPVDLIVTDMHYPIAPGTDPDEKAGLVLLERMEREGIDIPVIICSRGSYPVPRALGSVRYHETRGIEFEFKEVLGRL